MDLVHDKSVSIITSRLVQDTAQKFRAFLSANPQQVDSIEKSQERVVLDPSTTHTIIPPVFMVALGSVAGAGKTSLSKKIGLTFNSQKEKEFSTSSSSSSSSSSSPTITISVVISAVHILPMDGYHRYRSELSAMKDPEEAFRRRGAPYTFNDEKYAASMEQLRSTGKLSAPEFDHAKKDPEEGAFKIDVRTSYSVSSSGNSLSYTVYRPLVVVEGIYCLYDDGDFWAHALRQFDLKVYLRIPIDMATERLTKRHMRAWGISEEEARLRAAGSDRDNGLLVIERANKLIEKKSGDATLAGDVVVLESIDDEEFARKMLL